VNAINNEQLKKEKKKYYSLKWIKLEGIHAEKVAFVDGRINELLMEKYKQK